MLLYIIRKDVAIGNPLSHYCRITEMGNMNMKMKQLVAVALASVMTFGAASVAISPVSYAHDSAQHEYADGTTNKYSHALKEEEACHELAVRTIRYQYRQDGNEKQYQKDLKKEQKRHDKAVKKIKADSEAHIRHQHK